MMMTTELLDQFDALWLRRTDLMDKRDKLAEERDASKVVRRKGELRNQINDIDHQISLLRDEASPIAWELFGAAQGVVYALDAELKAAQQSQAAQNVVGAAIAKIEALANEYHDTTVQRIRNGRSIPLDFSNPSMLAFYFEHEMVDRIKSLFQPIADAIEPIDPAGIKAQLDDAQSFVEKLNQMKK
jgi:hypothetical protein